MLKRSIRVSVEDGVFSSEKTVSFNVKERKLTLLVDNDDLIAGNQLRVSVLDTRGEQALVDLPREPFSGGSRLLVPTALLQDAE